MQPHRLDHLVELLSSAPDEGPARGILVFSGSLADEHEPGIDIAFSEDGLGATIAQATQAARDDLPLDAGKLADLLVAGEDRRIHFRWTGGFYEGSRRWRDNGRSGDEARRGRRRRLSGGPIEPGGHRIQPEGALAAQE
jgi:hypothetical protein